MILGDPPTSSGIMKRNKNKLGISVQTAYTYVRLGSLDVRLIPTTLDILVGW